jgi:hypothetical protein
MTPTEEADLDTVLDELEGQWKDTPVPTDDRSPVPDGKYQARVDRVYLECDKNGTWRMKWELIVVAGPCAKRHLFHSNQINAQGIEWVKRDLARSGVTPPETMRGLRAMIDAGELLDRVLEVQTKTTRSAKDGKDYQNSYLNGLVSPGERRHASEQARAGTDDVPPPSGPMPCDDGGDDDLAF